MKIIGENLFSFDSGSFQSIERVECFDHLSLRA